MKPSIISSSKITDINIKKRNYSEYLKNSSNEYKFTALEKVKSFISSVRASGGGDTPEDVVGGLKKCLDQNW